MRLLIFTVIYLLSQLGFTQQIRPSKGIQHSHNSNVILINASAQLTPKQFIANCTIHVKGSLIIAAGRNISLPEKYAVVDLEGQYVCPAFIEPLANFRQDSTYQSQKNNSAKHWNPAIHPEYQTIENLKPPDKANNKWRKMGYGIVNTHLADGIMRGQSAAISLSTNENIDPIISGSTAHVISFQKGKSKERYPNSQMGAIALLRQTYYDAEWYELEEKPTFNSSLEALSQNQELPTIAVVSDYLEAARMENIAEEFGKNLIVAGAADLYRRVNDFDKNTQFILPLKFPKAYDVTNPWDAEWVSLEQMKHWELASHNPRLVNEAGYQWSITSQGSKSAKAFFDKIYQVSQTGIDSSALLAALTETPAKMLGIEDKTGSIEEGKRANFIVTNHSLFEKSCVVRQSWVDGIATYFEATPNTDISGNYNLVIEGKTYPTIVKPKGEKWALTFSKDSTDKKGKVKLDGKQLTLNIWLHPDSGSHNLAGKVNFKSAIWDGKGQNPAGEWAPWRALRTSKLDPSNDATKQTEKTADTAGPITYPMRAYGFAKLPMANNYLIQNATVWTNADTGIINNCNVLVQNGKITAVGKSFSVPDGTDYIDGTGLHLTSGIIDEHSHIAISKGVNEGTQAVTAEVRIGDVIRPDDINIYRQLSGGVTASQLLHGSANPVGGQSALIKLRWGQPADSFKIKDAKGFIKFALGENVKQSNWSRPTGRYPQTRMGVEQVYYDAFYRAKKYQEAWTAFDSKLASKKRRDPIPQSPRVDLELEALVEILQAKRFISCHSYVQSEINMLMSVADSMGFRVNTFTHILEGYKLAKEMKTHGVAASTFADWWAYKFEVNDAIPYNAAILNEAGVLTGINSDDAEMGRRLNQEAAKTMKYGGVSEEDAWKMVTLNPAKMLHLDQWMGSIEVGKDADLVLWSDHPLSINAKALKTFVDGKILFDRELDASLQQQVLAERARLINKMLKAKSNGKPTQKPTRTSPKLWHCDD